MSIKHKMMRIYFKIRGALTCREFEALAYDFLEGKLDKKTTKAIEKHMRLCPPCIFFMDSYRRTKEIGSQVTLPPLDEAFKKHLRVMFEG